MSQKNISKNYIYNLSYQILTLLTPLITTPYLSRILGADGIGTVSYVESIVSYFVLFATMGITIYGQREISYVQNSVERRSIVFWNTKIFSLCTSTVALILYMVFALRQAETLIYLIFALNILSVATDITWFYQGMEEFGKIVLRNVVFKIIHIAYVFLAIQSAQEVPLYAFGHVFFAFASNASLWVTLPKYVQKVRFKDLHPFKDVKVILSLFVPTIAISIYTVLDKTMIGAITQSAYENGYYEQALKISRMVLAVITSLGTVIAPRVGYYFEQRNMDEVKNLMYRSYRFVWFLGIPLCFGLIVVAGNFVPWFFGPGYDKVADLLSILAFLILVIGISNVTGIQFLIPTKRQNLLSKSVILGAVTNFCLNIFLIKAYGAVGAAIASVAAELVVTVSQLYFVRKELSLSCLLKESVLYLLAGIVMSVILCFVGNLLTPSILHTAILVICGASIYFLMLLIFKDDFFMSNVRKIYAKLLRK